MIVSFFFYEMLEFTERNMHKGKNPHLLHRKICLVYDEKFHVNFYSGMNGELLVFGHAGLLG